LWTAYALTTKLNNIMPISIKTKEDLEKEISETKTALAVTDSKIEQLCKELGVEPNEEVILKEIESLNKECEKLDANIESLVKVIEESEAQYQQAQEEIKAESRADVEQFREQEEKDDFE
jgi:predicted  nucleic acid-binding Zn-ribbon protein